MTSNDSSRDDSNGRQDRDNEVGVESTEPSLIKTFTYSGGDENLIPNDVNKLVVVSGLHRITRKKWRALEKLCHLDVADPGMSEIDLGNRKTRLAPSLKLVDLSKCSNVLAILSQSLRFCRAETILLPPRLTKIGKYGLANSRFGSITLPETTSAIGELCFADCSKLKTVVFESTRNFSFLTIDYRRIVRGEEPVNNDLQQYLDGDEDKWYGPKT